MNQTEILNETMKTLMKDLGIRPNLKGYRAVCCDAGRRQQREEIDKYMAVSGVEIARSKRIERRRKRC